MWAHAFSTDIADCLARRLFADINTLRARLGWTSGECKYTYCAAYVRVPFKHLRRSHRSAAVVPLDDTDL